MRTLLFSSKLTDARLVEVSTRSSMSCDQAITPCGQQSRALISLSWFSLSITIRGAWISVIPSFRSFSVSANSSDSLMPLSSTHFIISFPCSRPAEITANASRGIAFLRLPPLKLATEIPNFWARDDRIEFIIFTELPYPLWISSPEWPPRSPVREILKPMFPSPAGMPL